MPNPMFQENRNLSMELMKRLLNQDMGVLSGATPFSMTPQFKAIFEGLSRAGEMQDRSLSTDLTAKGITGGAYEKAMSDQSAGRNSALLDVLNKAWGNVRGNAIQEGDMAFKQWSDWYNKMLQYQQMKNQKDAQSGGLDIMKLISMIGSTGAGIASGIATGGTSTLAGTAGVGAQGLSGMLNSEDFLKGLGL